MSVELGEFDRADLDRTTTLPCLTDECEEKFSAHTIENASLLRDFHHLREHDGDSNIEPEQ